MFKERTARRHLRKSISNVVELISGNDWQNLIDVHLKFFLHKFPQTYRLDAVAIKFLYDSFLLPLRVKVFCIYISVESQKSKHPCNIICLLPGSICFVFFTSSPLILSSCYHDCPHTRQMLATSETAGVRERATVIWASCRH